MTAQLLNDADGCSLEGSLTVDTVAVLVDALAAEFASRPKVSVECSRVAEIDSAGVALLLEWWCQSSHHKSSLELVNMPSLMRDLLVITGTDWLTTSAADTV